MENYFDINLELTEIENIIVPEDDDIKFKENLKDLESVHDKEHRFDRPQACHHQR